MILFLTSNTFKYVKEDDPYVKWEFELAKETGRTIHIVQMEMIDPRRIPDHLVFWWKRIGEIQAIDITRVTSIDQQAAKIIRSIGAEPDCASAHEPDHIHSETRSWTGAVEEPIRYSQGLEFKKKIGGTYVLTGPGTCRDTKLMIPPTAPDGGRVTSIGDHAFDFDFESGVYIGLTSVTIPNCVTSIGKRAFEHCELLTAITIPDSVTSIGEAAFSYCSGLASVRIPHGVTSIGKAVFANCSGLTSVSIPDSVTAIGELAFAGCSELMSITIPNSVTSIGDLAFYECSGLTSVTIPNSVTSMGEGAFSGCDRLVSIHCAHSSQPKKWDRNWNPNNRPVVWNYKP